MPQHHIDISIQTLYSVQLKHIWQRLQPRVFLGMTQQALLIWIWGFSAILICRSSQALSGWMGSVSGQPEMFDWVQVRVLAGPLRELSLSHSCVVLVVCLGSLSCWMVNLQAQSEVLTAFIKDISVLCSIQLYLNPDQFPSPCKTPPQDDAATIMLTAGMILGRWWAVPGLLQTWGLQLRPNNSILVSSDQRILFLTVREGVLSVFF